VRCVGPEIFFVQGFGDSFEVEPEKDILLTGCTFGERPGEVRLVYTDVEGAYITFQVLDWEKNLIRARLPRRTGVPDHEAHIQVVRNNGQATELVPVQFRATRDYQAVFGGYMSVFSSYSAGHDMFSVGETICAPDPPDDLTNKRRVSVSYEGYHRHTGSGYISGPDTWFVNLENGWVLFAISDWKEITGKIPNHHSMANQPVGYAIGSANVSFRVSWWINSGGANLYYHGYMLATGPIGMPYASAFSPSVNITAPDLLPGTPCGGP
jgi:hypothetical protein